MADTESAGSAARRRRYLTEEAVPAPIDTASDAYRELADDEEQQTALVLMPVETRVDSSSKSWHDAGVHL